ncbi:uncharacterized protein isoform X3 [Leptinotarsa decemlineata]|uniref:uncharacterized protein isoform X3 n=1 Tax=Leptinotarsa decemlineata TaxID=7539 RepID=UPI003D30995A
MTTSKAAISNLEMIPKIKSRKSSPSMTIAQSGKFAYRLSPVDDAILRFRSTCQKYKWMKMPIPLVYDEKKRSSCDNTDDPKIWLSFKKTTQEELLDTIIFKNENIENSIFPVLKEWQQLYKSITVLKFENCGLTAEKIELLADLIESQRLVQHLSVNGNPNREQNFYILLKDTKLVSLSLKLCGINLDGIRMICEELSKPLDNPLLHLNLASNNLYDEGMEYVAKFLRINRKILSQFTLSTNDKLFESLFDKRTDIPSLHSGLPGTGGRNLLQRKRHFDEPQLIMYSLSLKKAIQLPTLCFTDNRIKQEGLQNVIDMLDYQRSNYSNDKGISRISLEGNNVNGLVEIEKLLAKKPKYGSISSNRSQKTKSSGN